MPEGKPRETTSLGKPFPKALRGTPAHGPIPSHRLGYSVSQSVSPYYSLPLVCYTKRIRIKGSDMALEERVSRLEGAYEQVDRRLDDLNQKVASLRSEISSP